MSSANITIRMDSQLKKDFSVLCDEIGLSMGAAFTVFAKAAVREGGIPFSLNVSKPNKETLAAMLEAEQISKDPTAKKYNSVEELFAELNADEI